MYYDHSIFLVTHGNSMVQLRTPMQCWNRDTKTVEVVNMFADSLNFKHVYTFDQSRILTWYTINLLIYNISCEKLGLSFFSLTISMVFVSPGWAPGFVGHQPRHAQRLGLRLQLQQRPAEHGRGHEAYLGLGLSTRAGEAGKRIPRTDQKKHFFFFPTRGTTIEQQ